MTLPLHARTPRVPLVRCLLKKKLVRDDLKVRYETDSTTCLGLLSTYPTSGRFPQTNAKRLGRGGTPMSTLDEIAACRAYIEVVCARKVIG